MQEEGLTGRIIGAAVAVHRQLGPGFLESIYENALAIELERRGLRFERQRIVPILYEGQEVGQHRLDLLVEDRIVVELKAVKEISDIHFVITRSYLCALVREHGLILNFAKPVVEVRRVKSRLFETA